MHDTVDTHENSCFSWCHLFTLTVYSYLGDVGRYLYKAVLTVLQPQCYTLLPQLVCADQWTVVAAHEYLVRLPDRGGWTGSGQSGERSVVSVISGTDWEAGRPRWFLKARPRLTPCSAGLTYLPHLQYHAPVRTDSPSCLTSNAMLRQGRTLPASPPTPCSGRDEPYLPHLPYHAPVRTDLPSRLTSNANAPVGLHYLCLITGRLRTLWKYLRLTTGANRYPCAMCKSTDSQGMTQWTMDWLNFWLLYCS